jgi:hypothetical protein
MSGLKSLLQHWNFIRILRLVLGGAILIQGIVANDVPTMLLGSIFGGMAVANIGCCGPTGCNINTSSSNKKTSPPEALEENK